MGVIGDYNCVKFSEIDTDTPKTNNWIKLISSIACGIKHWYCGIDANDFSYFLRFSKYNFGQDNDVEAINNEYQLINDPNIIAYGVSRGSRALINWIAKYRPLNIKAIILEGTPTDLDEMTDFSPGYLYYYYQLVKRILPYISSYDPNAPNITDTILDLPRNIPILFITSEKDKTVPYQCSLNIYQKLINNGFTNVSICVLGKAGHDDYISNNDRDRAIYYDAVMKIYEQISDFNMLDQGQYVPDNQYSD